MGLLTMQQNKKFGKLTGPVGGQEETTYGRITWKITRI